MRWEEVDDASNETNVDSVAADVREYSVGDLTECIEYVFYVSAATGAGEGDESEKTGSPMAESE